MLPLEFIKPSETITLANLASGEVHLWLAKITAPAAQYEHDWPLLSADEKQRAKRLVQVESQQKFVMTRGILRQLLANYLNLPANEIGFDYGAKGKPSVCAKQNAAHLAFNVSDSGDYALFAFTLSGNVGVDIEKINPKLNFFEIATRYFSNTECEALQKLPQALQNQAFFQAWTAKEAILKGLGLGLSVGLDQFSVTLDPRQPLRLLSSQVFDAAIWQLRRIDGIAGYQAALAIDGAIDKVRFLI